MDRLSSPCVSAGTSSFFFLSCSAGPRVYFLLKIYHEVSLKRLLCPLLLVKGISLTTFTVYLV